MPLKSHCLITFWRVKSRSNQVFRLWQCSTLTGQDVDWVVLHYFSLTIRDHCVLVQMYFLLPISLHFFIAIHLSPSLCCCFSPVSSFFWSITRWILVFVLFFSLFQALQSPVFFLDVCLWVSSRYSLWVSMCWISFNLSVHCLHMSRFL